ncbi:transcriptional regulator [Escherichia sp. E3659]|nr:transcriptional regulator [Escherichia sp. E3659]
MLKMRKKAPFQVLFCGLLQTFNPPGIDSTCRNWYLT